MRGLYAGTTGIGALRDGTGMRFITESAGVAGKDDGRGSAYSDEASDPERREGVCKEVLEYARGVAEGARYTDSFCVISGLDTGVCSIDAAGEPRSEGVIIVGTSKL